MILERIVLLLGQVPPDGGVMYAETNLRYIVAEPWNAISSLTFWIPVFYWYYRLRYRLKEYPFIALCLPLLFLGGLGSALFHAFRASPILLLMDILPILVLTIALSIYFWLKVLPHWSWVFLIIIPYFIIQALVIMYLPSPMRINLAYFMRGTIMFLPAVLLLRKIHYNFLKSLLLGVLFFILALVFRSLDKEATFLMYMGSHWLWHISTAVGSYYIAEFLYRYKNYEREVSSG
ncbi:MAG: hypothetical protein HC880_01510 [Bacteroidia bacterium]|nr:hypothetical protein [Bacteroidia bacterium]